MVDLLLYQLLLVCFSVIVVDWNASVCLCFCVGICLLRFKVTF